MAICYGNCQSLKINRILLKNIEFSNEYFILELPAVYEYKSEEDYAFFKESFWKECDLLISQKISRDNIFSPELATEMIEKQINPCSKTVWVPNAYFAGYFPQAKKNQHNIYVSKSDVAGLFPFGDIFVDRMLEENISLDEIIKRIKDEDFLEQDYISQCIEKSFTELIKREKECSITISDYIRAHYKEKLLFYCENHPCNDVLKELAERVLKYIGISDPSIELEKENMNFTLRGQDIPIYPSVLKAIGLEKEARIYFANRYLWVFNAEFEDFIRKYIEVCYGKID